MMTGALNDDWRWMENATELQSNGLISTTAQKTGKPVQIQDMTLICSHILSKGDQVLKAQI